MNQENQENVKTLIGIKEDNGILENNNKFEDVKISDDLNDKNENIQEFVRSSESRRSRASLRRVPPTARRVSKTPTIVSRGSWGSKWEFLLSCVGLSVGKSLRFNVD